MHAYILERNIINKHQSAESKTNRFQFPNLLFICKSNLQSPLTTDRPPAGHPSSIKSTSIPTMYPSLSGHRQHRSGAGCSWKIHPLHLSSTTTMFLVLLLTCLLLQCGSGSASAQEIRSPGGKPHKFMRWGKRFLDSQGMLFHLYFNPPGSCFTKPS